MRDKIVIELSRSTENVLETREDFMQDLLFRFRRVWSPIVIIERYKKIIWFDDAFQLSTFFTLKSKFKILFDTIISDHLKIRTQWYNVITK